MIGKFTIRESNQIIVYEKYEDIPQVFDNIIEFSPEYPEPPHTQEQHDYIETFVPKLHELLSRERRNASRNKS
jgi:hypothetical protein